MHNAGMREQLTEAPALIHAHYSPRFYAELWQIPEATITRWFENERGVLKVARRTRIELRIPFALAKRVYEERTR